MIININTEFIKLSALIKFAGITGSGGMAKNIIEDGLVMVNNEVEIRRGRKIYKNDIVKLELNEEIEIIVN